MANNPRLPLEVVELIIDDVAAVPKHDSNLHNNYSSIKACALVCHSFLPLCRKYIFASVTLDVGRPSALTSDDLNRLLSNSPHLAEYIRELDYRFIKKEFGPKRSPWLSSMFKKLVNLQKLSINYFASAPGSRLDWMSSSERMVLLPLLHLPTLTRLYLARIRNFPLADLAGCVNLKKLEIRSLECSNGVGDFLETLPPTPAMLQWLEIIRGDIKPVLRLCDARRPDGKPIIDFSSLKKITATVARLDSMKELLGICRNLHKIYLLIEDEVSLDLSDSMLSLKGLFTMLKPSLPTLVVIDIEYHIDNDSETYYGPLAGLYHELEKMTGQNVVETINLGIWVQPGYNCTRWGELDDVLMGSPEGWPALRKVSLSFNIISNSKKNSKALREIPMVKLVESKRVEFDFEVNEFPS